MDYEDLFELIHRETGVALKGDRLRQITMECCKMIANSNEVRREIQDEVMKCLLPLRPRVATGKYVSVISENVRSKIREIGKGNHYLLIHEMRA